MGHSSRWSLPPCSLIVDAEPCRQVMTLWGLRLPHRAPRERHDVAIPVRSRK